MTVDTVPDAELVPDPTEERTFIASVLEASTEYAIIGNDLDGKILLWNEGARRLYGWEPHEVVNRATAEILHTPENLAVGKRFEIRDGALCNGKWEGVVERRRKDGGRFYDRLVVTVRRDRQRRPIGYLLISARGRPNAARARMAWLTPHHAHAARSVAMRARSAGRMRTARPRRTTGRPPSAIQRRTSRSLTCSAADTSATVSSRVSSTF